MPDAFTVDLIELADEVPGLGVGGRVGMCRLPGYEPAELAADIAVLRRFRPSLVVTLNRADELYWLPGLMDEDNGFFSAMARAGFHHRHFAIQNGGVPAAMAGFAALVEDVCAELHAGRLIVIHCIAGHGRTGTLAACCLVKLGLAADRAIEVVRRIRPGTLETVEQEAFVGRYAVHLAGP
jgi:hypothetical protein